MKGILNRGINKIELVNNIRENGEGIEINKNYINKLKKEVSYEEALMFLCMSTVEIYGLEKEIERLNNIIKKAIDFVESMEYCGQEDYFYDLKAEDECGNDNTFNDSKYKLLEILDKGE